MPARRIAAPLALVLLLSILLTTSGCSKPAGEPAATAGSTGTATAGATAASPGAGSGAQTDSEANAAEAGTGAAPPRNFKVLGREDAPVAIIEFTDLQCPYCAQFSRQTFPKLRARYIDTGRVKFGSSDLPLEMHPQAVPAAVAARCAGEQGRYWEYRERVFEMQNELGNSSFTKLATDLGLDAQRFESCRQDGRQLKAVAQDAARAATAGIQSTPTFVIGRVVNGQFEGETLNGIQPYEVFAQRIDALLATP